MYHLKMELQHWKIKNIFWCNELVQEYKKFEIINIKNIQETLFFQWVFIIKRKLDLSKSQFMLKKIEI